jgi:hypothetical protein
MASGGLTPDIAHAQKEQFVRSKPHVNAGSKEKPKPLYFPEVMLEESKHGASRNQTKLKTNSQNGAASGLPSGKRQHKFLSVTNPAAPLLLEGPNNALGGTGAPVTGTGARSGGAAGRAGR